MATPNRDRVTDGLSRPDSRSAEPFAVRSALAPIGVAPRDSVAVRAPKSPVRRDRRTRRLESFRSRVRFRPQVGLLEQRALLSALPTLTALRVSTASAFAGESVTFTATVSDLSPGGATPNGGTVTFSDAGGAIGSETLAGGVAEFTASSLAVAANTVTASYGGTASFAPSTTGTIVAAAGGYNSYGSAGNNGPATAAELNSPWGIAVDSAGDLFIADSRNYVVREVVKATGDITTVAGDGGQGYSGDNGPATAAELNFPVGVAVDSVGDLFIADSGNDRIREVVKATGDIITVAGNGNDVYSGDNGAATAAGLNTPDGVAVDSAGDLFIADTGNRRIREVVKATGDIITVAGNGTGGTSGDNGPATAAELNPTGLAVDAAGDLFIADSGNFRIREVVKATGDIITVAGNGTGGTSGDNGPATAAELIDPDGVALDSAGDLFIADSRVREVVKATGHIITVAGNGTEGYSGNNGPATAAEVNDPIDVAVDSAGDLFITDFGNDVIREVTPAVTVNIIVAAHASATAAASASAVFSTSGQDVPLSATVTSVAGTVNEGTETFTILSGTTPVGNSVTVDVSDGAANASYTLPAGTPAGSYVIQAVYNGTADFGVSSDTSQTLTVSAAASATAAASASATFNGGAENITLSATITSAAGTVDEGTETFTIVSGTTTIGSAVTVNVSDGAANTVYALPAGTPAGIYIIVAVYNGTTNFLSFTDNSQELVISAAASATAAASASATFNGGVENITLSATITSAAGTVDEGTETFTIVSGTNPIGSAVTVNVSAGAASTVYVLPAGTPAGIYIILAVYNGTTNFLSFTDNSEELVISAAATVTAAASASATFNGGAENITLSATITSAAGTVNAGTETFTILNGTTTIGSAVTVNVSAGAASAVYVLPAGTPAGIYIILAVYNGTTNFLSFTDNSEHLVISAAATATAAASASATFNGGAQDINLSATITSAAGSVNAGTETFTIVSGTTTIGSAVTVNVSDGAASTVYVLPAGTPAGIFIILAVYNGTTNFLSFTDNSEHLVISAAATVTDATNASATFSAGSQVVNLSATVTSTAGTVDTGTETFTILNGTTAIGSAITVNVSDGGASAVYVLPSGTPAGTYIILAVYNGTTDFLGSNDNSHSLTVSVPVAVNKLVIHTQPSSIATAGQDFAIQPVIYLEDSSGNLVMSDNTTVVTVSLASGNGTLQGTKQVTVSGGVATFAGLSDNTAGVISLSFAGDGLTAGPSSNITVGPAAPFQLVIHTQPSPSATAGQPLATGPVVYEEDQYGNLETGDDSTVITASLGSGNGPLRGTANATLSGGVATFGGLFDDVAGIISLNFAGAGFTAGPSNNIFISPGSAAQLVIQTPPFASVTAGNPLTDPIVIDEEDQYGNIETGDNSTVVTASLNSGAGSLDGTKTATVTDGVASFNDLEDDTAGTLSLKFGAGTLPPVVSNPSIVKAAPATQLAVTTAPPDPIIAGQAFVLVIAAEDQFNNVDTNYSGNVTISLATDPGFVTTVSVKNGLAIFSGLTLPTTAEGGTIQATAGGLSAAATSPVRVTPPQGGNTTPPSPTIIGESIVMLKKTNKKGKPVGKAVFEGFNLVFSTAMNPSTAGLAGNYTVDAMTTKRKKKTIVPVFKPVTINKVVYSQSNNIDSVSLTLKSATPFAKGGRITIINTLPNGVSSAAGGLLNANDTVFTILPKAKGMRLA